MTTDNQINQPYTTHQLEQLLTNVKQAAQLTFDLLDNLLSIGSLESDELQKAITLRQAILDFKGLEVKKGINQTLVLKEKTLNRLNEIYGISTNACFNRIVNDLLENTVNKEFEKYKQLEQRVKLKKVMDLIEKQNKEVYKD